MTTETKRILNINDHIADIRPTQIAVEPSADSDLGFRMWGGKDAIGNVTKFLAKDQAAQVASLVVTELTYGLVATDVDGEMINIDSLAGLNATLDADLDESTDPREPTAHASSHMGGSDPITFPSDATSIQTIPVVLDTPSDGEVLTAVDIGAGVLELQWVAPTDSTNATAIQDFAVSTTDPTEGQSFECISNVWTPVNIPTLIKNYVDLSSASFHITEYFSAVVSGIGAGYYDMARTAAVAGTVVSAAITDNTITSIYKFATTSGQPHLIRLLKGPYELHAHLYKTGNRTITITYKLYQRAAGGTETLLSTSNTSSALTASEALYEFVFNLDAEVTLLETDRIVLEVVALSSGSAGNTTVTTVVGGAADSHFTIDIEGSELPGIFIPYTGATGAADLGVYGFSAATLTAAAGSAAAPSIYFTGDTDTGAYSLGANAYGIAVGGVHSTSIDQYRNLTVGATTGTARFQVVQGTAGVGTVTVSGTAVTGVGTQFTNTFKVGDTITVTTSSGSETKAIATITSDTVLVTAAFSGTAAAGTAYTLSGGTRFSVYGNGNITIGVLTGTATMLNLPLGTTAANGINLGGDVNLYRSAANELKTDDNINCAGYAIMSQGFFTKATKEIGDDAGRSAIVFDSTGQTNDASIWGMHSVSSSLILTAKTNEAKDHYCAAHTHPTLYIFSATDPDSNNTQWISISRNASDGVITSGSGNLLLTPASSVVVGTSPPSSLPQKFYVWGGNASVVDASALGSESLTDGTLPTDTNWDKTGACLTFEVGGPTWYYSGGSTGVLTQLNASMAVYLRPGRWYAFSYTTTYVTLSPSATITTDTALSSTALPLVNTGATPLSYTIYFKSAVAPSGFNISSTPTAGQGFVLTNCVLKEIFGGDVYASGNVGIGTSIFGTGAKHSLAIGLGTNPSTSAPDQIEFFAYDYTTDETTIGIRTEKAVAAEVVTCDHTLYVSINGANYRLMLAAPPA